MVVLIWNVNKIHRNDLNNMYKELHRREMKKIDHKFKDK